MIPNGYDVRVLVTASPSYGHVNPCLRRAAGGPRGGARHRQGADGARRHGLTVWEVGCGRAESDARFRAARPDLEALALDERLVRLVEGCSSRPRPSALRTCSPGSSGGGPTWSCTKSASWRVGELASVAARPRGPARRTRPRAPRAAADVDRAWGVPRLAADVLDTTYLDPWRRSLRPDAAGTWSDARPIRPGPGTAAPDERLPWPAGWLAACRTRRPSTSPSARSSPAPPACWRRWWRGCASCRSTSSSPSGRRVIPTGSARGRRTWSSSDTCRTGCCCRTATCWSITLGRGSCSPGSATACPSCSFRKPSTSSPTPKPPGERGAR